MFLVAFLRWLFGYLSFTAEGTFPESLMNLAARRGIHLWNMKGEEGRVSGCAREKDIRALKEIAEKIHKSPRHVSAELKRNSTKIKGIRPHGKDCRNPAVFRGKI